MDDVQLPAHAPLRPGDAFGKLEDLRIGLVKLDLEKCEHRFCEPGNILSRTPHQLWEISDAMAAHEARQVCVFNIIRRWLPNEISAEIELVAHPPSLDPPN